MREIADWLNQLGMSEYAQRFAENRIDFSVLPDLTDQHLKDLGIALGDRLKLLRAIRELGGTPLISPKLSSSEPKIQDIAERRQVTVLFSRWHCHWAGCRRRPYWIRRSAGARHRRRNAKSRSTPASDCRAEHRGDCRSYSEASGQSVRA